MSVTRLQGESLELSSENGRKSHPKHTSESGGGSWTAVHSWRLGAPFLHRLNHLRHASHRALLWVSNNVSGTLRQSPSWHASLRWVSILCTNVEADESVHSGHVAAVAVVVGPLRDCAAEPVAAGGHWLPWRAGEPSASWLGAAASPVNDEHTRAGLAGGGSVHVDAADVAGCGSAALFRCRDWLVLPVAASDAHAGGAWSLRAIQLPQLAALALATRVTTPALVAQ